MEGEIAPHFSTNTVNVLRGLGLGLVWGSGSGRLEYQRSSWGKRLVRGSQSCWYVNVAEQGAS